jgi:hypothetical protein
MMKKGGSLAKLHLKPTRLWPGMAIPLKAISIAFCGRGAILRVLSRFVSGRTKEFCYGFNGANPQNHPAALPGGIFFEISPFGEQPSRLNKNLWLRPGIGRDTLSSPALL